MLPLLPRFRKTDLCAAVNPAGVPGIGNANEVTVLPAHHHCPQAVRVQAPPGLLFHPPYHVGIPRLYPHDIQTWRICPPVRRQKQLPKIKDLPISIEIMQISLDKQVECRPSFPRAAASQAGSSPAAFTERKNRTQAAKRLRWTICGRDCGFVDFRGRRRTYIFPWL